MANIFLNYNEKGGVGKTTLTGMQSYLLAEKGYKILDVDLDPQHNLTNMLEYTYRDGKRFHPALELYKALENNDISSSICNASKNLDIAPSNLSLFKFQEWDNAIGRPVRWQIINETLKKVKSKYDFIFLDVPPTFNAFSINAIYAADYVNIVVQTQRASYTSALDTISMIDTFHKNYNFTPNVLGVILYLIIKNAKVDRETAKRSQKTFGNYIYKNNIIYQERVKGFTDEGIRDKDYWDHRAIGMYSVLNKEIFNRMEYAKSHAKSK